MVTVEELVVKATPTGIDDVNSQLDGMEKSVQETTDEVEETGRSLDDMSAKFKGAMGAIIAGLGVAAGGILSRVPSIQVAVEQLGTTLDLLGQKFEEEFSESLQDLNDELAETNKEVAEAEGALDALMKAIQGFDDAVQDFAVSAIQNKIKDITGITVPENWIDFGWDILTLDAEAFRRRTKAAVNDLLDMQIGGGNILNDIRDAFTQTKRRASQRFRELRQRLKEIMKSLVANLKRDVFDFTDTFVNEIGLLWVRSKEKFDTLRQKADAAFGDMAADAKQSGKDLINNFADGIKSKADAAEDAVRDIMGTVRSLLPSSPADTGPLSDLDTVGPGLVDTITTGVKSSTDDDESDTKTGVRRAIERNQKRTVVSIDGREVERATQSYRDNGTDLRGRYG